MAQAPTGTVTFLFTDIEGSTKMWERSPEAIRAHLGDALATSLTVSCQSDVSNKLSHKCGSEDIVALSYALPIGEAALHGPHRQAVGSVGASYPRATSKRRWQGQTLA